MKLPLPADYFQCPPLSAFEREGNAAQARQNVKDMLDKADMTNQRYQWKRVADEAELEIFRGRDPYAPETATLHCATLDLVATMDEFVAFCSTDTTDEAKELVGRTGHGVLDIVNLYTISDTPDAKVQLQWVVGKSALDGVVKKRDFCLLEGSFLSSHATTRRTFVRCLQSIQVPCCPEFPSMIRGVVYGSGLICRETDRPGYLQLSCMMHFDPRGHVPFVVTDLAAKEMCRMMKKIDRYLREDRLGSTPYLMGPQFVPLGSRQRCFLCKKSFGPLRSKKNCFKCGEVLCRKCCPEWKIKAAGTPVKLRACTPCSLLVLPKNGNLSTTELSDPNTAMSIVSEDSDDSSETITSVFFSSDSTSCYTESLNSQTTPSHSTAT
ncbi:unnamed protein product [Aphanomyces euteiches]|uniref:FYVE-type domain-containing protein n=1 Tax=Aphanomyces euteiches TaxID=100861 RepID=A0A6G0WRY8_9STRA|nr:hypothetical protein Ae201684_012196 [Aphanomyces euteiches]